ncbi:MAG: hypothetical protein QUU85_02575, partial [Candidatus Eisenbacteria bacterium]|nr:hypothetical protein [Candidatus Eisenbacteria bacterium]
MRAIFLLALGILALPATAFAFPESAGFLSDVPVSFPDPREDIYCQLPSGGWGAVSYTHLRA